jgi:hypothetical protein
VEPIMAKRSLGVTVLAASTIIVALYSQYAALSLLVGGSVLASSGDLTRLITTITATTFVGLTAAGYVIGVALWMRKAWSRGWAMGFYLTFSVANALLAALIGNIGSAVLLTVGVAVAVVFLNRPRVRAELQGAKGSSRAPAAAETPIAERIEAPGPAH